MSSSNDVFEPEDFENLIAAVDSIDPLENLDEPISALTTGAETLADTINLSRASTPNLLAAKTPFTAEDELYDEASEWVSIEVDENTNFTELENLASDFSELDFGDEKELPPVMSLTLEAQSESLEAQSESSDDNAFNPVSQFVVDDPFASKTPDPATQSAQTTNARFEDNDFDNEFASLIEVAEETYEEQGDLAFIPGVQLGYEVPQTAKSVDSELENEFAEFDGLSELQDDHADNLALSNSDESDEFSDFDGIAAANEISNIYMMDDQDPVDQGHVTLQQENPLIDSMTKTQKAAEKLKSHLASIAAKSTSHPKPEEPSSTMINKAALDLDKPVETPLLIEPTETITLRETEDVTDDLLAAFIAAPVSENKKSRKFSLNNFANKFPKLYLTCTTLLAMVGFGYILAIPALLGYSIFNGFEMMNSPFTSNMALLMLAIFSISLFLFMVSYRLFDLKFIGPGGITLNHENASALIDKIQQLKKNHSIPKIHEIVLTRRHELNLIKVPRLGFPIWSKNVLAIGYPLLQTLPADYFDVALSRRLTQFNKRKNTLHNWLSFMRRTWTLFAVSLKERKGVIDLFHYCFFAPYASLYRNFAVYVSQKDELLADEIALRNNNDRDLLKTAQTLRITRAMLINYFWPKLNEELQANMASPKHVKPYSELPGALNKLLRAKNIDAWFIRLGQEAANPGDSEPPFARRMEVMGHSKVAIPAPFDVNAAQQYFGEQYGAMTELLDTLWADEVQKELFMESLKDEVHITQLPCRLSIEPA